MDTDGRSAADRHVTPSPITKEHVRWKDVLSNQWKGPDPVLVRSRGAVCVFPQDQENPIWIPARLTRTVKDHEAPASAVEDNALGDTDDSGNGGDQMGNHVDISIAYAGDA